MKVWCFWMALTLCCMTLMPIFVARSLWSGARGAPLAARSTNAARRPSRERE